MEGSLLSELSKSFLCCTWAYLNFFFLCLADKDSSSAPSLHGKLSNDLSTLLRMLADSHGVLKGAPSGAVELSDEERALLTAVTSGEVNEVQRLLSVPGRASMVVNAEGDCLLHMACRTPTDRIIAAIARLKPDLNATNKKGRTPLHDLAACGGSLAILGKKRARKQSDLS